MILGEFLSQSHAGRWGVGWAYDMDRPWIKAHHNILSFTRIKTDKGVRVNPGDDNGFSTPQGDTAVSHSGSHSGYFCSELINSVRRTELLIQAAHLNVFRTDA